MTIEEDIARDQSCIFGTLAIKEDLERTAWKLYRIDPVFAIGTLFSVIDQLTREYGVDFTKELRTVTKKLDKKMAEVKE